LKKTSSWKFERVEKEYHSGDRELLDGRKLIQVTAPVEDSSKIDFAVKQLKKYGTPWVIQKVNGWCALFREKT